jgi:thymidylate synthase
LFFKAESLDDLLMEVYPALRTAPQITATRGTTQELIGVSLKLTLPRARLSRSETRGKAFSPFGELLWYLTRDNELSFIKEYIPQYEKESEDGKTVFGGYGPRLFSMRGIDQIANTLNLLRDKPTSRRAVIQIFDAADISGAHKEIPCTTTLQFLARDGKLHMSTTMRSNDAYMGLPHDVFAFTMFQEIMARSLSCELGDYHHYVGSLHVYEKHYDAVDRYVSEKWQARIEMPAMPMGNPWPNLNTLLVAEALLRDRRPLTAEVEQLDPYWRDLVRLLNVFWASDDAVIADELRKFSFGKYAMYARGRLR